MAGGVGERIFLYQNAQMHCPDKRLTGSFRACSSSCSAYRLEGDDVPSGRRWPCCHTPLSGVHVRNSAPRPDCHIPVPAPGVPRAQCGAVSARRSGHHRLHERPCASRQRRFRRLRQRIFLLCPFNGRDGLIHQAGVLQDGRLWPFPVVPVRVADIQGWCQTFPAPRHFRLRKL